MILIKRDIDAIVKVMEKFGLQKEWDSVKINYEKTDCGYNLSVNFSIVLHDILCNVEIPIEADMFDV